MWQHWINQYGWYGENYLSQLYIYIYIYYLACDILSNDTFDMDLGKRYKYMI